MTSIVYHGFRIEITRDLTKTFYECNTCGKSIRQTMIDIGRIQYCLKCGRARIDTLIANLKFQQSELKNLLDELPNPVKKKDESGDINITATL